MKKILSAITIVALAGCASTSDIVPIGKDTYMVGTQVRGGFESWTEVKSRSIKTANDYCAQKGMAMALQGDIKTSGVRGWTPQNAEVTFKCEPK